MKLYPQTSYLRHCSCTVAHRFLSSSLECDHLFSDRLPHEPLINNPGHTVVASAQHGQRSSPSGKTFWFGLIHDAQTTEAALGVSLRSLPL